MKRDAQQVPSQRHGLELAIEQQDATVAELAAKARGELDRGTT